MLLIIKIIFLSLAAFFNSVMDKLETLISFNSSVYKKLNPKFWCKPISSERPFLRFTKYRLDAWHLSKSLMIICICAAMSSTIIEFIICGLIWNVVFNLMYNKALKSI